MQNMVTRTGFPSGPIVVPAPRLEQELALSFQNAFDDRSDTESGSWRLPVDLLYFRDLWADPPAPGVETLAPEVGGGPEVLEVPGRPGGVRLTACRKG